MLTSDELRELAAWNADQCAGLRKGYAGALPTEPCGYCKQCRTAAALREAAELREQYEQLRRIHDGTWWWPGVSLCDGTSDAKGQSNE